MGAAALQAWVLLWHSAAGIYTTLHGMHFRLRVALLVATSGEGVHDAQIQCTRQFDERLWPVPHTVGS